MDIDPLIRWLYSHRAPNIKWELDTMRALLRLMGEPQLRLAPVLVAGTNGKGSVAAMLHAMAGEAGLRAGMFTSPHLVRPEERIRLGGEDIAPDDFLPRVAAMKELIEAALPEERLPRHPSFFEMTAAIAMGAMADHGVELAVLEVGLGGRLDATNAADPLVSVITNIGLEHTKTLGETTGKIAGEKAGILRSGAPLVTGVRDEEARAVLDERAAAVGAPVHHVPSTCTIAADAGAAFDLETPCRRYAGLRPGLAGAHQRDNAAVAVRAAELLAETVGLPLGARAIRDGLAAVRWPGRLERVEGSPPVYLDGAHNPDGCRAVAAFVRSRQGEPAGADRRVLVFAAMGDKGVEEMLGALGPVVDRIVVTRAEIERSAEPTDLLVHARGHDAEAVAASGTAAALDAARRLAGPAGVVLVAGSLFLVGEARAHLMSLAGPGNPSYARVPRVTSPAPLP